MHTCIYPPTYPPKSIHPHIHTHIHTYIHTHIHKNIHTPCLFFSLTEGVIFESQDVTRIGNWSQAQAPLTPSNWSVLYRGRGSPVMSWILLKANNGQQASGVGDKRCFRFKRNAYHLWTAIIRHRLNDNTRQQIMRFNQGSKFANIS